jgi:hypothetical protein
MGPEPLLRARTNAPESEDQVSRPLQ